MSQTLNWPSFALHFVSSFGRAKQLAILWYEGRREGLGDELFIAIENVKHLIERNPYHFEDKYLGIRKAITRRFPYIIYYRIESDTKVLVYAVLHMRRSSRFWKGRLSKRR